MVTLRRSDGATFIYGDIFRILSYGLTGVGKLDVEIFTEPNAQDDGDMVTGERVPMREIRIAAQCIGRSANQIARRVANRFFVPAYDYEIHLDYKGVKAWIPARLDEFDMPTENPHRPQSLSVTFLCPDPYFLSEDSFGKNIAQVVGCAGFPYMENPAYGWIASYYDFSRSVVIENDGDVVAYPLVEITANGHVENPKVIKDKYFVKVLDTMEAGGRIVIDFGAKTIRENPQKHFVGNRVYFTGGANITQKASKDSSLLSIAFEPGPGIMSYAADDGENVMSCYIYLYQRYVGV